MQTLRKQGRFTRVMAWFAAILLALSYILSANIVNTATVLAAEVQDRSILMGNSEENAETTYTVTFTMPAGTSAGGFRIEFCDDNPLPHVDCDFQAVGDDIPQVDANAGSAVTLNAASNVTNATGGDCDALTLSAITNGDNHLDVVCDAADNFGGLASTVTLVLNNINNPSNATDSPNNPNNTFYARIYVFSDETPPAYVDPVAATEVVHTGGIAMSTAEQLTITARVQEILEFCVGTNTSTPVNCAAMTGNSVDLGVLDFQSISYSLADEGEQGAIWVTTNAASGVVIDYFAEQASTGSNHLGALRVSGATCNAGNVEFDQCINSAGTTQTQFQAGEENFGLCVHNVEQTFSTTNIAPDGEYDGACDNSTANDGFAFDETGTADRLAASTTVVHGEMIEIDFAGTSDVTTPTGLYTVTLTFIGTATF